MDRSGTARSLVGVEGVVVVNGMHSAVSGSAMATWRRTSRLSWGAWRRRARVR